MGVVLGNAIIRVRNDRGQKRVSHKLSVSVSDEMMKQIEDYRYGNRISKMQTAVLDLLQAGIERFDQEGKLTPWYSADLEPKLASTTSTEEPED